MSIRTRRLPAAAALVAIAAATLSTGAHAELFDRGSGLVYDSTLNITWLKDSNFAKTSGFHPTGAMTRKQALSWVAGLAVKDTVRGTTLTGWRLPKTGPVNGVAFELFGVGTTGWGLYDGSSDVGYWTAAPGTVFAGSRASELANLYYYSLGNRGYCGAPAQPLNICSDASPNANNAGFGAFGTAYVFNAGPFVNIVPTDYWGGDLPKPRSVYVDKDAFGFHMFFGSQIPRGDKELKIAWAVRDGDVTTPNAVPAAPVAASLSVKTSGGKALVTSTDGRINCGSSCSASLPPGSVVTLNATPEPGFKFVSWTGACTGTTPSCTLQVFGSMQVQANLTK